jgi:hypothetical protein
MSNPQGKTGGEKRQFWEAYNKRVKQIKSLQQEVAKLGPVPKGWGGQSTEEQKRVHQAYNNARQELYAMVELLPDAGGHKKELQDQSKELWERIKQLKEKLQECLSKMDWEEAKRLQEQIDDLERQAHFISELAGHMGKYAFSDAGRADMLSQMEAGGPIVSWEYRQQLMQSAAAKAAYEKQMQELYGDNAPPMIVTDRSGKIISGGEAIHNAASQVQESVDALDGGQADGPPDIDLAGLGGPAGGGHVDTRAGGQGAPQPSKPSTTSASASNVAGPPVYASMPHVGSQPGAGTPAFDHEGLEPQNNIPAGVDGTTQEGDVAADGEAESEAERDRRAKERERLEGASSAASKGAAAGSTVAEGLGKTVAEGARKTSGYAQAAKGKAAEIFAEGGEEALRVSGVHKAAAKLETAAQRASKTAARIKTAGNAMGKLGTAMSVVNLYTGSSAETVAGKAVSSLFAGGSGQLLTSRASGYLLVADLAAMAVEKATGLPMDQPSTVVNKAIDTLVTIAESALTWDAKGLETLQARNLAGKNGHIFQAAAEAGEFWSDYGVAGGARQFWNGLKSMFE